MRAEIVCQHNTCIGVITTVVPGGDGFSIQSTWQRDPEYRPQEYRPKAAPPIPNGPRGRSGLTAKYDEEMSDPLRVVLWPRPVSTENDFRRLVFFG